MKVMIGFGENRFTMSRGSFKYKQKITKKRQLTLQNTEKTENGYLLTFADNAAKELHRFKVTCEKEAASGEDVERKASEIDTSDVKAIVQEGEKITVDYQGEVPQGINRFWITLPTNADEKIYGCGETYSKFNLKGENVRIWVAEHQNTSRISKKIISEKITGKHPDKRLPFKKYESYYAQPTFTSSDKYYMHVNVNAYSEFDFRKPEEITLYLQEAPSFVIESAATFTGLSEKMSNLLGRQKALPDWIYDGVILAVQEGTEVIEKKIKKALDAGVKVNGIWSQDWSGCRRTGFGYQVMWNWQWDKELYPDLDKKLPEWREKGIHFLGYINPFIALEKELYQIASKNGYCVKNDKGEDYQVTITTFPAAMVDFTNPEAYEWYKGLIKENMIGLGMSGWMADFGEYLPVDAVLYSKEDPKVLHNQWPAIWAKLNQEAIAECGKENEVFFFTRAGHTGTIKHSPMMWTGDQHVDWSVDDGLPSVIPATLSLAMSGYGITHSDAGGYTTIMHMRRSKELLMRWEEMNVFSPLFRTHEGNQPVNDVQFDDDDELLAQMARCSKMHANLKEYLKKCVKEQENAGTPVMRPLFYHYNEAPAYEEMTEYLLGRDILVAPILVEGTEERTVYLPKDEWVHLFSGKEYQGGNVKVKAKMGQPPVFIRKGAKDLESLLGGYINESEGEERK